MTLILPRLLLTASLLPFSTLWLSAQTSQELTPAQLSHMQAVKREQLVVSARQAITDGQRLLNVSKFDEAADRFQFALDALTNGGVSAGLYAKAEAGLAAAKAGQASNLAKDAKFAQAAELLQQSISLEPNDPTYTKDLADLKKQQEIYEAQIRDPEGTINNPAVTDDLRDKVAAAQKLLFQGDAFFNTGQYDKAEETYSKVLILDPYNKAARLKMDHVERYRLRADSFRHEQYEQEGYEKLDLKWSEAISPDIVIAPNTTTSPSNPSNRAAITRKLQSIIIDKVNFDKLDIGTVIEFLTQKSKELDPDHEGINFVLRLTSDTPPTPAGDTTTPSGPTPAAPGATPAAPDANAPKEIHRQVSITLENVPLAEVLNYIVEQTNLQYTVEDYAIYLRPSIDEGETLTVRTFLAPPNFFSQNSLRVNVPTTDDQSTTVSSVSTDVQAELVSRGIRFPEGATATFLPGSSKLVVRNTPEQLDLIANLIDQLSQESPQVEIESKLVEFNQDAIKGLGFNYTISPVTGGFFQANTALRDSNYTGSDDANGGLEPNSVDTLIQQNVNSNSSFIPTFPISNIQVYPNTPNTLTVGATIDGHTLAAVMSAINNIKGVSLMTAPNVTTQNGLKANIDLVREFPYPTSFDKPKLSTTAVAYSSGPGAGLPLTLALPPTPREFVNQDVGVSLEVKPTTYPDQRIDLDITKCEVVDFDGFIDYGQDIVELTAGNIAPQILTAGVINQPVFNLRSVVTRLQVLDGETAVLGGLIREDTQEINDKVPVLGDIPLVGRFFQSKVTERTKKNLLIFITARLIRSNGKPEYTKTLDAEPEEEKLPEPESLGTGVTLPPLPPGSEGGPNS